MEAIRVSNIKTAPVVIEHPWKSLPLSASIISECMNSMFNIHLFPGNWDVEQISCANGSASVTWKSRTNGWIEHLLAIEPRALISPDGLTASISVPFFCASETTDEDVPRENERIVEMFSASQRYHLKFEIQPPPPVIPTLPGQEVTKVSTSSLWKEINWKVSEASSPDVVLAALNGKGFRLKTMTAKLSGGLLVWTMEGSQYVNP